MKMRSASSARLYRPRSFTVPRATPSTRDPSALQSTRRAWSAARPASSRRTKPVGLSMKAQTDRTDSRAPLVMSSAAPSSRRTTTVSRLRRKS
jgi:hypothetical protein